MSPRLKQYDVYQNGKHITSGTMKEISKELNYSINYLKHFVNSDLKKNGRNKFLIIPVEGSDLSIYAFYQGQELIAVGNKYELAKQFNVKPETIVYYNNQYYKNKIDMNKDKYTVRIE